jgi:hypothetical protein
VNSPNAHVNIVSSRGTQCRGTQSWLLGKIASRTGQTIVVLGICLFVVSRLAMYFLLAQVGTLQVIALTLGVASVMALNICERIHA